MGFFHSSLAPTIEIGAVWPPKGIPVLNPWEILFKYGYLIDFGASVTWAHHALLAGAKQQAIYSLVVTVILAIAFTSLQVFEYIEAPFTIADGIYGSTFFLATGFHGFHVFVGTVFLGICLMRVLQNHFTKHHHFGLRQLLGIGILSMLFGYFVRSYLLVGGIFLIFKGN